jgi:hypothetical protein
LIERIKEFIDFSILHVFGRILKLFIRYVVTLEAACAPSSALPTPSLVRFLPFASEKPDDFMFLCFYFAY